MDNIEICGNEINYNVTAEDEEAFISSNYGIDWGWNAFHCLSVGGQLGDKERKILFTGNTIKAPNVSANNKHLMYFSFKEEDKLHSYVFENNNLEKYTWVRSQIGSKFNVTYDNADLLGNKLEFDTTVPEGSRKGKNYIKGAGSTEN